jgi:hypothetical protein
MTRTFVVHTLVTAILALGLVAPASAQAPPVPGGAVDIYNRVTALEKATNTLKSQVTTLQGQVSSLQSANTALQTALTAEITARQAADTALQTALTAETAARQAADNNLQAALTTQNTALSALQQSLSQETASRIAADQQLQAQISAAGPTVFSKFTSDIFLTNGEATDVLTLSLPAGNYVLIAKSIVNNPDHDVQWLCGLRVDNQPFVVDSSTIGTETGDLQQASLGLATVVALSAPTTTVNLNCRTGQGSSFMDWVQLIAIQVGLLK